MANRPAVIPCSVFKGRSPITKKLVGSRHRWSGGKHGNWGKGTCDFCGHTLQEVLERPQKATDKTSKPDE